MPCKVRFTQTAKDDIERFYTFLAEQDVIAAQHALTSITKAINLLKSFPFTCRKVSSNDPFLRELVISFGANGYVALFEIESDEQVTILCLRHHREDDYR
jgi:plasmid stabilization system protein ParE